MFDSIEQLEKQVKRFQENILASTDLVDGIRDLSSVLSAQQEQFRVAKVDILTSMVSNVDAFEKASDSLMTELTKRVQSIPADIERRNAILGNEIVQANEKLVSTANNLVAEFTECVQSIPVDVERKNATLTDDIRKATEDLVSTANTIRIDLNDDIDKSLDWLESACLDFITDTCREMQKDMNSKMNLLIVGMAIAILLLAMPYAIAFVDKWF